MEPPPTYTHTGKFQMAIGFLELLLEGGLYGPLSGTLTEFSGSAHEKARLPFIMSYLRVRKSWVQKKVSEFFAY